MSGGVPGTPHHDVILAAIEEASRSGCQKSHRGVVIFSGSRVLAMGSNAPARGICDGSEACRRDCAKICRHAEQVALLRYLCWYAVGDQAVTVADALHIKVDADGLPVPSGTPSCAECSKLMLGYVAGVWLLTESGWRRWTAAEFHHETLVNLKLHGG